MSRPRRPFGAEQPGRLQATMLRVLAAELSDGGRLARGKRLRADDAVVDLVIGHGAATAQVQGSRPVPYVVTLLTRPGRSVPGRRDVTVRCTCPDDDGTGTMACKHVVAAMFALADEVSLDPGALARWRQTDALDPGQADTGPTARIGRPTAVAARVPEPPDPTATAIAGLLRPPVAARLPELPELAPAGPIALPDPLLAGVLDDALAHLRVRWD